MEVAKKISYSTFAGAPYNAEVFAHTLMNPASELRKLHATLDFKNGVTVNLEVQYIAVGNSKPDLVERALNLCLTAPIEQIIHKSPLHRLEIVPDKGDSRVTLELLADERPLVSANGVRAKIFSSEQETMEAIKAWSRVGAEFGYNVYRKTIGIAPGCEAAQICVAPRGTPLKLDLQKILENKDLNQLGSDLTVVTKGADIYVHGAQIYVWPKTVAMAHDMLDLLAGKNAAEPTVSYAVQVDTWMERAATRISNIFAGTRPYVRGDAVKLSALPVSAALFGGALAYAVGGPVIPMALTFATVSTLTQALWFVLIVENEHHDKMLVKEKDCHDIAAKNLATFVGSYLKPPAAQCYAATSTACATRLPKTNA